MADEVQVRKDGPIGEGDLLEGKYRIVRPIAEGGMGALFYAIHEKLGRDVAVKILKPIEDEPPERHRERVARFFREASFSSQLNHPNTMTIFDYGELSDGGFFLVMEYLEGQSLRDLIQSVGALPPAAAVHIGIQIASSLADAHAAGVIHRDLKPPNVMLVERGGDPFFVKVVDFGLVKKIHGEDNGDDELTAENTVVGSPIYVAPERFLHKDADSPAVDVYSLGILLYEMLVGRPPFTRDDGCTVTQLILKHVNEHPPPLHHFKEDLHLPEGLESLIKKCLEKDPAHRIPSMESLLQLLKSCAHALEYNPHSPISPLSNTGTMRAPGSGEMVFNDETGEATRNVTANLSRPMPATAAPVQGQRSGAAHWPPVAAEGASKKLLVPLVAVVLALVVVVGLLLALTGDEPEVGATISSEPLSAGDLPAAEEVALEEPELLVAEPAEEEVSGQEEVVVEEATPEQEEEVAAPPRQQGRPPRQERTRPAEEPSETQPPVQIRMDR